MAQTALEHCRKLGFKVGVSVVDRGGHVLVTLRDHGAAHHTVELAQRKALTSRGTRLPSGQFAENVAKTPNAGALRLGNMIPARGALPIKAGEEVIGAVGVSGAPGGDKDEACAQAGIDKVADQLK